jgi:hypothetical protein
MDRDRVNDRKNSFCCIASALAFIQNKSSERARPSMRPFRIRCNA